MGKPSKNQSGFGVTGVMFIIVIILLSVMGYLVYKNHHKIATTTSSSTKSTTATTTPNPYAGWKSYCDSMTKACFKYPSDWVAPSDLAAPQNGSFENAAQTEYVSLSDINPNKDGGTENAYVVSVADLNAQNSDLKIVGAVVGVDPVYSVYNSTYVASNGLKAGSTLAILGGSSFTTKSGANIGLDGTPDVSGSDAIKTLDQAKAWFNTAEAKEVLLVMQSFYSQ